MNLVRNGAQQFPGWVVPMFPVHDAEKLLLLDILTLQAHRLGGLVADESLAVPQIVCLRISIPINLEIVLPEIFRGDLPIGRAGQSAAGGLQKTVISKDVTSKCRP